MENKNMNKVNKSPAQKSSIKKDQTVEVLYQKMGDRWFAFSMIDDEIFVGSIAQSEVDSNKKIGRDLGHK